MNDREHNSKKDEITESAAREVVTPNRRSRNWLQLIQSTEIQQPEVNANYLQFSRTERIVEVIRYRYDKFDCTVMGKLFRLALTLVLCSGVLLLITSGISFLVVQVFDVAIEGLISVIWNLILVMLLFGVFVLVASAVVYLISIMPTVVRILYQITQSLLRTVGTRD